MARLLVRAFLILFSFASCSSLTRNPDIINVIPKDKNDLPSPFQKHPPCDPTPFETYVHESQQLNQRQRYQAYLSTLLADAIKKMEGIHHATIELVDTSGSDQELQAKITIVYEDHRDEEHSGLLMQIKRLAVAIIPNLKMENVVIMSHKQNPSSLAEQVNN
ncbi:MAG: hypothetical protein ACSNEK_03420 [Parachlamydiaceae bacterium]